MNSRNGKVQTVDKLLKDLNSVSKNVEDDINSQVNEYLNSLDDTYIPNTSGDTTRFADSVYLCMEDKYQQNITGCIATIASEYSDRYSKCLGKILRLQLVASDIKLDDDILAQISECKDKVKHIGMVDYILKNIASDERGDVDAQ